MSGSIHFVFLRFHHAAICVRRAVFFIADMIPLCGWITAHLSTHLFMDSWPYYKFLTMKMNVHIPV